MNNKLIPIEDNIVENISTKLTDYLDLKDSVFENEFVEAFGDSFKVVKLLKTGHVLISRRKFNSFLKGFCYDDIPSEEQLSKLNKYIDQEKKAEFIADMFSKVFMSNSKLACMVMGIMLNDLTVNNEEIKHEQLICANALVNFFDNDVINYYKIINFIHDLIRKKNWKRFGFYEYNFKMFLKGTSYDEGSFYSTLQKSISYQLIISEPDLDANFDSYDIELSSVEIDTYFYLTNSGKLLNEYIDKMSSHLNG